MDVLTETHTESAAYNELTSIIDHLDPESPQFEQTFNILKDLSVFGMPLGDQFDSDDMFHMVSKAIEVGAAHGDKLYSLGSDALSVVFWFVEDPEIVLNAVKQQWNELPDQES